MSGYTGRRHHRSVRRGWACKTWRNAVRVVPLGKDVTAVIHVVSVALRAALIFGNVTPGDAGSSDGVHHGPCTGIRKCIQAAGSDVIVACGAGAIALGFPVVTNETENIFTCTEEPDRSGGCIQVQRYFS